MVNVMLMSYENQIDVIWMEIWSRFCEDFFFLVVYKKF